MGLLAPDLMRKLEQLELRPRRPVAGRIRGEQRSVRKGHSLEFADYRTYIQGDDLRFVDWKIFARLDRLFLKMFMEEEDLFVYVLLDASHSMGLGEPPKFACAIRLAAAVSYLALAGTHRISIQPFASTLRPALDPIRGRAQYARVEQYLQGLAPEGTTETRAGLAQFRGRIRGAGMVFLVSDLFDRRGTVEALKPLLAGRFEVAVIHLLSPDEETPAWEGDWKLLDIEDGDAVGVSMSARLREAYAATVRKFRAEQQEVCSRYGFTYIPILSDRPVESLVMHSLRRRGVVR